MCHSGSAEARRGVVILFVFNSLIWGAQYLQSEEFCFFIWLNLFSSQTVTYFLLWAHLVLSRDTASPLASVTTRPSLLFSISAVFHVGLDLVLDLKRHCLLSYACLFLPPFPPSCPSLTLFLASCPLLPLAMAYDLIFWCPSSNLYAICHFFPEKSFMSRCCNFWSHDEGQASDLIWNLTSTYSDPEFVSTFVGICNLCLFVWKRELKMKQNSVCCNSIWLQGWSRYRHQE